MSFKFMENLPYAVRYSTLRIPSRVKWPAPTGWCFMFADDALALDDEEGYEPMPVWPQEEAAKKVAPSTTAVRIPGWFVFLENCSVYSTSVVLQG